jgi:hypothetical protein
MVDLKQAQPLGGVHAACAEYFIGRNVMTVLVKYALHTMALLQRLRDTATALMIQFSSMGGLFVSVFWA